MCRNTRQLRGAEPLATEAEIRDAALPFARKVSGDRTPSAASAAAFEISVDEASVAVRRLLANLAPGPGARPIVPLQRRKAAAARWEPSRARDTPGTCQVSGRVFACLEAFEPHARWP